MKPKIYPNKHPLFGQKVYDSDPPLKNTIKGFLIIILAIVAIYFLSEYCESFILNFLGGLMVPFLLFFILFLFSFGVTKVLNSFTSHWHYVIYKKGIIGMTFNPRGNVKRGEFRSEYTEPKVGQEIPFEKVEEIYVYRRGLGSGLRLFLRIDDEDRIIVADLVTYIFAGSFRYKRTQKLIQALKRAMKTDWERKFIRTDILWEGEIPGNNIDIPAWEFLEYPRKNK